MFQAPQNTSPLSTPKLPLERSVFFPQEASNIPRIQSWALLHFLLALQCHEVESGNPISKQYIGSTHFSRLVLFSWIVLCPKDFAAKKGIQACWFVFCNHGCFPITIPPYHWPPHAWVLIVFSLWWSLFCVLWYWYLKKRVNIKPFIKRGQVSLYAEVDTFWKMGNGHSHVWSSFLLGLVVYTFLLLNQTWLPMFQCGVFLTPFSISLALTPALIEGIRPAYSKKNQYLWVILQLWGCIAWLMGSLGTRGYTHSFPWMVNLQWKHEHSFCVKIWKSGECPSSPE